MSHPLPESENSYFFGQSQVLEFRACHSPEYIIRDMTVPKYISLLSPTSQPTILLCVCPICDHEPFRSLKTYLVAEAIEYPMCEAFMFSSDLKQAGTTEPF